MKYQAALAGLGLCAGSAALSSGALTNTDQLISSASQTSANTNSILTKIHKLIKSGELPKNLNKIESFTQEEVQIIRSRRAELIKQGKTDFAISKLLSVELQRPVSSLYNKLLTLEKSGELPENPNKLGRKLTEDEMFSQLVEAVDVYTGGGADD